VVDEVRVEGLLLTVVEHAPGLVLEDHAHDGATIGILLRGAVAERRDGLVRAQAPGDVFVRPKGVRHANQYFPSGSRSLFVELEPDDPRAAGLHAIDALVWPELARHGEAVARAFEQREKARTELFRCAQLLVSAAATLRRPRTPPWLVRAKERLAHEFQQPPTLRELAEDLRVHPVHLAQAFRARWGLTPGAFVRAHRVFTAVPMIQTGAPLAQVAYACGFADQSHMTRVVRSLRGAPPGYLARRAAASVTQSS